MSAKKVNKAAKELLITVFVLFLLLLTSININNYLTQKKVLGIETNNNTDVVYWQNFLLKNPDYIPGWLETGDVDRVHKIDPNYKLEISSSVLP